MTKATKSLALLGAVTAAVAAHGVTEAEAQAQLKQTSLERISTSRSGAMPAAAPVSSAMRISRRRLPACAQRPPKTPCVTGSIDCYPCAEFMKCTGSMPTTHRRLCSAVLPFVLLVAGCATTAPPDCSEGAQFQRGLAGDALPDACRGDAPPEAYNLATMIREAREEAAALRAEVDAGPTPARRAEARQRLIRIERDLPELEALARMEGWLPPAALPGG